VKTLKTYDIMITMNFISLPGDVNLFFIDADCKSARVSTHVLKLN